MHTCTYMEGSGELHVCIMIKTSPHNQTPNNFSSVSTYTPICIQSWLLSTPHAIVYTYRWHVWGRARYLQQTTPHRICKSRVIAHDLRKEVQTTDQQIDRRRAKKGIQRIDLLWARASVIGFNSFKTTFTYMYTWYRGVNGGSLRRKEGNSNVQGKGRTNKTEIQSEDTET